MSSNAAKLKKRAAEFEQKKQFDKALQLYIQVLEESPGDEEADVALYNRVGDLLMRENRATEAVTYYEKAVDLYAEGGFFNNAIALCNKILRQAPHRNVIYYKLGKISAKKGFTSDAKQNFLEYADRMQNEGKLDEAFRALKEFADLCPDQDDIRLMLADQLSKKGRNGEAIDQLQRLYDKFEVEGRGADMRATVDRMKAIDAKAEPASTGQKARVEKPSDLVFLDLGDDVPVYRPGMSPTPRYSPAIRKSGEHRRPSGSVSKVSEPSATTIPAAPDTPSTTPVSVTPASLSPISPTPASFTPTSIPQSTPTSLTPMSLTPALLTPLSLTPVDEPPALVTPLTPPETIPAISPVSGIEEIPFVEVPEDDLEPVDGLMKEQEFHADVAPPPPALKGLESSAALEVDDMAELPTLLPNIETIESASRPSSITGDLEFIIPEDDDLEAPPPPRSSGGVLRIVEGAERLISNEPTEMPSVTPESVAPLAMAPPSVASEAEPELPPAVSVPVDIVADLRAHLEEQPDDWALHRELGELLFTEGQREEGLHELEQAMIGYEGADNIPAAQDIVQMLLRADPNSVRHYQKRAEYALRAGDTAFLPEAYMDLGEALFRSGQVDKAKAVYQRVLEIAPDNTDARVALRAFGGSSAPAHAETPAAPVAAVAADVAVPVEEPRPVPEVKAVEETKTAEVKVTEPEVVAAHHEAEHHEGEHKPRVPKLTPIRGTGAQRVIPQRPEPPRTLPPRPQETSDSEFVNLGDWLREDNAPKSTRFVIDDEKPTGNEAADFADMLRRFKEGVAQNVELEDSDSHYDLGVAYKEMGLLDEAISEFQKALRGTKQRVRTYEALGQAFLDKKQVQVAATLLVRSLNEPGVSDEQLVGVLYLLGYASEALHQKEAAVQYYHRVFAIDIHFRDVAERLAQLENTPQ